MNQSATPKAPSEAPSRPTPDTPPPIGRQLVVVIGLALIAGWTGLQAIDQRWTTSAERAVFADPFVLDARIDAGSVAWPGWALHPASGGPLSRLALRAITPATLDLQRLIVVALHMSNVIAGWACLALLLRRLEAGAIERARWFATAAIGVWALHPAALTNVATVDSLPTLLSAFLLLTGTACYLKADFTAQRTALAGIAAVLMLAAQLAWPVPGWLLVLVGCDAVRKKWRVAWPHLACLLGGVYAIYATAGWAETYVRASDTSSIARVFSEHALTWSVALLPWQVAPAYPLLAITQTANAVVGGGLALAAIVGWFLLSRWTVGRVFGLALVLMLVSLPGSWLTPGPVRWFTDNGVAYLPSLGMSVASAGLLAVIFRRLPSARHGIVGRIAGGVVFVVLAVGIFASRVLMEVWRTPPERAQRLMVLFEAAPSAHALKADIFAAYATQLAQMDAPPFDPREAARESDAAVVRAAELLLEQRAAYQDHAAWRQLAEQLARQALTINRVDLTIALVDALIQTGDVKPQVLHLKAIAHRVEEDWSAAHAVYQRLAEEPAPSPGFAARRAFEFGDLLLHRLNRPAVAKGQFETALAADALNRDERLKAQVGLALSEIRGGIGERGRQILTNVLAQQPGYGTALLALGEYHIRSNHWKEAEQVYAQILASFPTHPRALRGMHEALAQQLRYAEAVDLWANAVELEPRVAFFRTMMIWSAACAGDETVADAARRLQENPEHSPLVELTLALLHLGSGDFDAALTDAQAARDVAERDPAALRRAAQAMERLARAGRLAPEAYVLAARLYVWAGRVEAARGVLAAVAEADLSPAAEQEHKALRELLSGEERPEP